MRRETKIAAVVVGLVIIGVSAWQVGWGGKDNRGDSGGPDVVEAPRMPGEPEADRAATEGPLDHVGDSTARGPDYAGLDEQGAGYVGSPASFGVRENEEASFRPRSVETFGPGRLTVRTGLAGDSLGGEAADSSWPTLSTPDRPGRDSFASPAGGPGSTTGFSETGIRGTADHHPATTRPADGRPGRSAVKTVEMRFRGPEPAGPAPVVSRGPMRTHVIQPGDTFCALAARYLGHAKYAGLIMKANPDLDPRRLFVGRNVSIPPTPADSVVSRSGETGAVGSAITPRGHWSVPPPPVSLVPPERSYTVQPGEGWYRLAKRFLGKGTRWPELYELNKDRVSANAHLLRVGTVIELPERTASTNP